jgi:hypothetical protein
MAEPCCRDAIVPIRSIRESRRGPSRSKTRKPCVAKQPRIKKSPCAGGTPCGGKLSLDFLQKSKKVRREIKKTTPMRDWAFRIARERSTGAWRSFILFSSPSYAPSEPQTSLACHKTSLTRRESMMGLAVMYQDASIASSCCIETGPLTRPIHSFERPPKTGSQRGAKTGVAGL